MEVLYTMNFHHVAIMSTNSTNLKWWNACKRQWKVKGQIWAGGKKWMPQQNNDPAHFFPSNYSWLAHKAHQTCPTTPVLTKYPMNRSLLVTKVEICTEWWNIESDDIQENSHMKLCAIPQKAFQKCSQKQKELREQCIRSTGNYSQREKAI
jgi:hypothetical protein